MKRNLTQAARLLVVALVIMLAFATLPLVAVGATPPEGTGAQGQPTRFRSIYVEHDATIAGNLTSADLAASDDLTVADTLDVNGDIDLDGDGFDVNITTGFSIDADLASNINAAAGDITVEAETGSVNIKGDEAAADAVYLDANDAAGTGVTIVVGSSAGLSIDGGLTDIGGGTFATADGDNDLGIDGDLEVNTDTVLGDGTGDATTVTGQAVINGLADADAANYDYWFEITGDMTGTGTKDRNYGLLIDMTRPAGQELVVGDHDEAGLKIQVINKAVNTVAGNTLRGINVMAKNDNPSGSLTNLIGGLISIQTDTGSPPAGNVSVGKALEVNVTANAPITDTLMLADFRLFRQTATEPTQEYGVRIRNSSTTGTGADAALWLDSDGSGETDDWGYGIDMSGADIDTADIRMENGETISNGTDTAVQIGGFLALTEGATQDLGATFVITPTASYQPITNSTGGSVTSDTSTAIADGAVAGALLVVCNEDAQDMVIKDNANTLLGGDITLTGGAQDCLTVLWNGADWVGLAVHDN